MSKLHLAVLLAAASLIAETAHAANTIQFADVGGGCGAGVLCSTDGTHGYLANGRASPFKASTISKWFQINLDGKSRLKGQPAQRLRSGSFLVVNDREEPIENFSVTLKLDVCGGPGCGVLLTAGSRGYRYAGRLTRSVPARRGGTSGKTTMMWTAGNGGQIPPHVIFRIAFSGWNTSAAAAPSLSVVSDVLISKATDGTPGNGESWSLAGLTPDGKYVAFRSSATNLPGASSSNLTEYRYDTAAGSLITIPTPIGNCCGEELGISGDGSAIFQSGGDSENDYIFDLTDPNAPATHQIAVPYPLANTGDISGDARYVVYGAPQDYGDPYNHYGVYVYDRQSLGTKPMLAPDGNGPDGQGCQPQGKAISGNGQYILVVCGSDNIVPGISTPALYVWDQFATDPTKAFEDVMGSTDGAEGIQVASATGGISPDGRYVIYDTNVPNLIPGGTTDDQVFLYDYGQTKATQLVSVTSDGTQGACNGVCVNGHLDQSAVSVSADGRYVAFHSNANNLVAGHDSGAYNIYVKDLGTPGDLIWIAQGHHPIISADGLHIVYMDGTDTDAHDNVHLVTLQ